AGSTPAGATSGRTATGAVSRLENGCGFGRWGFDSLSFRSHSGVVERSDSRLLIASRRFESCRRSFSLRRSVSVAARLVDNEQGWVRFEALGLFYVPPWWRGSAAGSSPRGGGFKSRRGYFIWL